ncbi:MULTISPECIES: PepSY domain-containing protein [Enterococcaceae]|uniref:PepSY domain-containing protein n=1 Tax=Enterococcaceae TaxID=81852 RepID=UPI000E4954A3|nr:MULTISPECIES: PepSY domain-containing protein [Enterococcaceae]MCI0129746.1 PepSY domain-containing protein [Vagococcus sp. CY53-2]RGI31924.1 lysis protein [Melissococcus sp. OM08-11BH]
MKKIILLSSVVLSLGVFAGCSSQNIDSGKTTKSSSSQVSASSNAVSSSTSESSTSEPVYKVSLSDAIETYKETYPNTDIISISLDTSFGQTVYDIEGIDDNKEYSLKINTDTKEIKKEREENLDRDEKDGVKRRENKLDLTNLKDMKEIFDIALKEAGSGKIDDWEIKEDMGVTYWEVSIKDGMTKEIEYKINAQTGEIIETDID